MEELEHRPKAGPREGRHRAGGPTCSGAYSRRFAVADCRGRTDRSPNGGSGRVDWTTEFGCSAPAERVLFNSGRSPAPRSAAVDGEHVATAWTADASRGASCSMSARRGDAVAAPARGRAVKPGTQPRSPRPRLEACPVTSARWRCQYPGCRSSSAAQPFAAAALVCETMSAALPLPAIRFTTAVFIALPTFWPYSLSRNCME